MAGPSLFSPLVSTQWLADHLGADGLVVVDASVVSCTLPNGATGTLSGHEQYIVEGHLPGAVFADLIDDLSEPESSLPFTRPTAERFAAAAGALGIGPDTTVVAYDTSAGQWASRLWWLLRAFGHDRAAVLDGGLATWIAEGRDVVRGHVEPVPAGFVARERDGAWVDKGFVERVVRGEEEAALVCAVPTKEFTGEASARVRPGVIPGSLSVPASRLVDRRTRTTLPDAELRELFEPVRAARRIVAYCHAGIAATATALQLTRIGETEVAVYDGSLAEWATDEHAPLVMPVGATL